MTGKRILVAAQKEVALVPERRFVRLDFAGVRDPVVNEHARRRLVVG